MTGRIGPIDLVVDDVGDIVVNNVRVGIGAEASREGRRWKERLSRLGYAVGALVAVFRPLDLRLRIEVDSELVADGNHRVLDISIGNGATVGGGVPVNPDADPQSGQMDVVVSFAIGPAGANRLRNRSVAVASSFEERRVAQAWKYGVRRGNAFLHQFRWGGVGPDEQPHVAR